MDSGLAGRLMLSFAQYSVWLPARCFNTFVEILRTMELFPFVVHDNDSDARLEEIKEYARGVDLRHAT
jgi:hypothetical protein